MGRREPGYRPEPKLYKVTYDDHPGLIVRARSVSAGAFIEIAKLAQDQDPGVAETEDLFQKFSDVLVSWNLEFGKGHPEEGEPVPTTLAGLLSQDFDLVNDIIIGWTNAVAGVSAPLAQPSTGGSQYPVESIPMEVLSENRAS